MNKIDYDPKKFTKDAYGNLIPKKSANVGYVIKNGWPMWAGCHRGLRWNFDTQRIEVKET